ncbi:hypothetical protein CBR_g45234 [Chara braunii]|uniref:Reverse transcriptase RNase H-like domain-containing protein n=1 Tax=Chara braunii TaxID=69332 RepID=A0A388K3A5_CHABU|nr:hypothetical protein CBR_g45234 [Chara braunii]|eukprot:GBG64538.1 hypothetical protein CBR_g45234 [Chara braunii]
MHYEVVKLPDPDKPFIVSTDASQYDIGAVLTQQDGPKLRPVEYMSKKMPSQNLAKSTYEKELYAVYKALTHWRHYLLGRFFILRTDHQSLRWMRTQSVLSDALKHWIEVIERYDFDPQYLKGEYNKVVDALSCRPDFSGALITEFNLTDNVTQALVEAYREDQFMSEIIRRLKAKDKKTSVEFELVNGLLFLEKAGNKRSCVPNSESLRSLFLGECHDATGNFGYKKPAANLLQRFWWPTMMRDAQLYVETCQAGHFARWCPQNPNAQQNASAIVPASAPPFTNPANNGNATTIVPYQGGGWNNTNRRLESLEDQVGKMKIRYDADKEKERKKKEGEEKKQREKEEEERRQKEKQEREAFQKELKVTMATELSAVREAWTRKQQKDKATIEKLRTEMEEIRRGMASTSTARAHAINELDFEMVEKMRQQQEEMKREQPEMHTRLLAMVTHW